MVIPGFPRASHLNQLASSPLMVGGVNQNGTVVAPVASASNADNSPGLGLAGAGLLGFDGINYHRLTAAGVSDGDGDTYQLWTAAVNRLYNGVSWDRQRNNTGIALLPRAVRTADTDSPTFQTFNARAIILFLIIQVVPAAPGAGGLKVALIGVGPGVADAQFFMIASPAAALQTVSANLFHLGVGLPAAVPPAAGVATREVVNVPVPQQFFCRVSVGDAQAYDYSLSASLIV